jgi:hypothetical protein
VIEYYSDYFKKWMIRFYDCGGISYSLSTEEGLYTLLRENRINNLDYVEALDSLKKLKEKQNA